MRPPIYPGGGAVGDLPCPTSIVLWNFEDPAASEAAFRNAQTEIDRAGDHALLMELLTQIARAQGLQRQYEAADATLAAVEASLRPDEVRARIRYALERGRLLRSSGRPALARPCSKKPPRPPGRRTNRRSRSMRST